MVDDTGEIWKPVRGYEGRYDVSSFGRVRSLTRKVMSEQGKYRTIQGRMLKPRLEGHEISKRYLFVSLYKDGKERQRKIHHLVLEAFVGNRPANMEGCHKDGNSINNKVSNLKWATREENARDKIRHGATGRGEKSSTAILTEDKVRRIRVMAGNKKTTLKSLANMFGVGETTIHDIITRKSWKYI